MTEWERKKIVAVKAVDVTFFMGKRRKKEKTK